MLPVPVAKSVKRVAVAAIAGLCFTACNKTNDGATVKNLAWVATDASVTLPGTAITPVNLTTDRALKGVQVGSLPSAMAFTKGNDLLVVTEGNDMLHEVDTATDKVIHSVTVGVEPDAIAVAPGGTHGAGIALVSNLDSNSVTPVDLGTWKSLPPIAVGTEPVSIAVVASGPKDGTAFVADFGSNDVTPIDLNGLQPGTPIAVGSSPQTVAAAGLQVLVGNFGNSTLTPI
ncbi:MAG TPA: hypothetical protein VGH31_03125, partial [Acidimicrobiales bacterium]